MIELQTFRRAMYGIACAAVAAAAQTPAASPPVTMSLGDAIRAAALHSAPAEVARLRIDEAQARVTEARSALLPRISGNVVQAGRSFNTATFGLSLPGFNPDGEVVGPVNTTDLRGQIGQTIYDAAARARVTAARSAVSATAAGANSAAEQAASVAGAAYVRALRAEANLRSRTADSTLSADLLDIARQSVEAGVGIALDVTRAQSQLAGTRAQLIAARNDLSRSRLELLRAVGLPLDTPLTLADSLQVFAVEQVPDPAAAVDAALRQRADVRAIEEQIGASRQQINAIRAERLPTLGLLADEGLIGKNPAHLLPTYTWGVQVSLPIFDGNRRQARVAEQSAAIQELEVRERDLRAQVAVEVRGALLDLASAREQVEAVRERVRLAEQEVAQARDRFSAGVAGNADVISASLSLSAARTGLVEAEAAYQGARVALARAEGTLTTIK
jgi:outer membrane protein TolC